MAQETDVILTAETWTQLTDADVTAIRFQNISGYDVWIKATADTTAPTDKTGAIKYHPGQGENAFTELSSLFPGVSGADRVWAYCDLAATVSISHA